MPHHVRRVFDAGFDPVEQGGFARILHAEQFAAHHDRGEGVVQVVGDPAGQRADALHPLRAQGEALLLPALGDVAQRGEVEFLSVDEDVVGADFDREHAAVLRSVPRFKGHGAAPLEILEMRVPDSGLVVRIQIENPHGEQFPAGIAATCASCVVHVEDAPVAADPEDAVARAIHAQAHHLQRLLGLLAFGDVLPGAQDSDHVSRRAKKRHLVCLQPARGTVGHRRLLDDAQLRLPRVHDFAVFPHEKFRLLSCQRDKIEVRHPHDGLCACEPKCPCDERIAADVAGFAIFPEDALRDGVQDQLQHALRGLHGHLRPLAFGDVADGQKGQRGAAGGMHDFATVAEDALPIGVKAADAQLASAQFLAAHDAWQRPLLKGDDLAVQRRHGEKLAECLHLSARFLLVRETVLLNRGLVPVQDLAIQCGNHHALGEVLHDGV